MAGKVIDVHFTPKFKAPEPVPGEMHDAYLRRVVAAVEDWVNENYPSRGEPD